MAKKAVAKKVVKKTAKKSTKAVKKIIEQFTEEVEESAVQKAEEVVASPSEKNIGAEADVSGAPKNFLIKCSKCCWSRASSGLAADLTDIHEMKSNCKSCGKWRKFFCPKCGSPSTMKRIRGNS